VHAIDCSEQALKAEETQRTVKRQLQIVVNAYDLLLGKVWMAPDALVPRQDVALIRPVPMGYQPHAPET